MKFPNHARTPAFDAEAINATIQRALASAGLDTASGPMQEVTETIRRALAAAGRPAADAPAVATPSVLELVTRVDVEENAAHHTRPPIDDAPLRGTFETHEFSNAAGSRAFKLYVPRRAAAAPRPLLVMLHGCTQSADDFAAGTRMNQLADEHDFLVVYPEQAAHDNPSKCWNWFNPQHQRRDAGEPALIAGIVAEVAARHGVDPRRIFAAGLSAGAAMAVVLGQSYPELFAGVAAHSGLPYASAHDIPSALAAMKGGRSGIAAVMGEGRGGAATFFDPHGERPALPSRGKSTQPVPTIVFHGDRDHTVQPMNGAAIVQQARDAYRDQPGAGTLTSSTHAGRSPGGRSYSRTVDVSAAGQVLIETWALHGAGHAWSGGAARGSYTDGKGPDASAEMVRFFLALPRAGAA